MLNKKAMKTELTELRRHLGIYHTAERQSGKWYTSRNWLLKFYKKYGTLSETVFKDQVR